MASQETGAGAEGTGTAAKGSRAGSGGPRAASRQSGGDAWTAERRIRVDVREDARRIQSEARNAAREAHAEARRIAAEARAEVRRIQNEARNVRRGRGDGPDEGGTRERILDVALDLFTEQGYDKTSLREIAEQLGFSKAALYYHFASKEEILLALHLRLHEIGRAVLARLGEAPATPAAWGALIQDLIVDMFENRKLLLLHQRNHGAMKVVHDRHPDGDHDDFELLFEGLLGDDRIDVAVRVRLVCTIGAIGAGLAAFGNPSFAEVDLDDYIEILKGVAADLLPTVP